MSIKDRKKRENARLKQDILNAALQVFAKDGYARVSMRKIAAQIDYSATTIYRFFRNKEDLLQNIAADTYVALSARFEMAKKGNGGNPIKTLKALILEYIAFCVEQPEMFKLYSDFGAFEMEDGIMYERLGGNRYMVYQSWFDYIGQSIASGSLAIRDEVRVFLYLWDAVNGYIDHRIKHSRVPREPLAEDSHAFLDLLLNGIAIKKNG
jgi:AcrR family transcriptional regulator